MKLALTEPWKKYLSSFLTSPEYKLLENNVLLAYEKSIVFPPQKDIFNALNLCPHDAVKVIIIGQDPYHKEGQAHGLSFSVSHDTKTPPSLKNILKELQDDIGESSTVNSLMHWAKQGVLLLNSILTVEEGKPESHKDIGWELCTDYIIKKISDDKRHCVFILWGSHAQKKSSLIDSSRHLIIKTVHPSPLSAYRGFFGSKPFSKTNEYLKKNNKQEIIW